MLGPERISDLNQEAPLSCSRGTVVELIHLKGHAVMNMMHITCHFFVKAFGRRLGRLTYAFEHHDFALSALRFLPNLGDRRHLKLGVMGASPE